MRKDSRTKFAAAVVLAVSAASVAFATGSFAAAEKSQLELVVAPTPFVETGAAGFAAATFTNTGPSTVTQGQLRIVFDRAVSVTSATTGCTPATGSVTLVSCPLGQVPAGGVRKNVVYWNAPATAGDLNVTSRVFYDNDPNTDTSVPPSSTLTVLAAGDDADSKCDKDAAGTTASTPGVSATNQQATSLTYTDGPAGIACAWAIVGERAAAGAMCGAAVCTTQVWFASLPTVTGDLTLRLYELPKGVALSKFALYEFANYPDVTGGGKPVPLCVNGAIPAGSRGCEKPNTRAKLGSRGGIFQLLVQGDGTDPGYAG